MKLSWLLSIAGVWGIVMVGLLINHYRNVHVDVVEEVKDYQNLKFKRVTFSTDEATKESYIKFIDDLLGVLSSGNEAHGIPILLQTVNNNNRFVEVVLTNDQAHTITLVIEATNVYVWGYSAGTRSFYTKDAPPTVRELFRTGIQLKFESGYPNLENFAKAIREQISLGINQMADAISILHNGPGDDQGPIARGFIILVQMIAEAVRLRPIKQLITASIKAYDYEHFCPTPYMISLENEWNALATQVQGADAMTLMFQRTVKLKINYDAFFSVEAVGQILFELAIMKYVPASPRLLLQEAQALSIRDTPTITEDGQAIRGFHGRCAAADSITKSGYPVELRDCTSPYSHSQRWRFKRDGTVTNEDGNLCLTTTSFNRGSSIETQTCKGAARDAITWNVWSTGAIENPKSRYVLSVDSGDIDTKLKLEENTYCSTQSWSIGNKIPILERVIIGLNDLCLFTHDDIVWLVECSPGHDQKWALYPDGTIRTKENQKHCLVVTKSSTDRLVITADCSGSYNERWIFENSGNIKNLHHNMVLDVKGSDPSLEQIIILPSRGTLNQIWYRMP
ncbi:hypothetical protein ACFE04_003080 [Oxalis oulophora]